MRSCPLMIDDPVEVVFLVSALRQALPLAGRPIQRLVTVIREQCPDWTPAQACRVSEVAYAGDEGGVMCRLVVGDANAGQVFYVSITHLMFDRRSPLAREIASYQRRRNKRIKRLHVLEVLLEGTLP